MRPMRQSMVVLAVLVSLNAAWAQEEDEGGGTSVSVSGVAEVRYAHTGDVQSWLDGGLGKTRYGTLDGHVANLLTVPFVSLVVDATHDEQLSAHVQVNLDAEPDAALDRGRVGLAEAYIGYVNDVSPTVRLRLRGGLFFPPISLENRGPAWTTIYTITPSAANSWVGEEVRAAGVEGRLGLVSGENELWLTGAAFGWNDPTGTLLLWRGWALHDRQTITSEKLPLPPLSSIGPGHLFDHQAPWDAPIREIDGRLGYYAGAEARLAGRLEINGLYFDNRGDPASFDGKQYGWATDFWNAGTRLRLPGGFEVLGQFMDGKTAMGVMPDGTIMAEAGFRTWYVLGTGVAGPVRVSARYDDFWVRDDDPFVAIDNNNETGDAWTVAVMVQAGGHLLLMGEWLHVDSDRPFRTDLGLPEQATENLLQIGVRLMF
jgi:hypothetical protein